MQPSPRRAADEESGVRESGKPPARAGVSEKVWDGREECGGWMGMLEARRMNRKGGKVR